MDNVDNYVDNLEICGYLTKNIVDNFCIQNESISVDNCVEIYKNLTYNLQLIFLDFSRKKHEVS